MYTSFGQVMILGNWPFFSFWPLTMASMMEGWSDPRLTKAWLTPYSQSASKKAKDAVYLYRNQQLHTCSCTMKTYTMVFSLRVRAGLQLSGRIVNVLYRPEVKDTKPTTACDRVQSP
jgi:hypothetical protein